MFITVYAMVYHIFVNNRVMKITLLCILCDSLLLEY